MGLRAVCNPVLLAALLCSACATAPPAEPPVDPDRSRQKERILQRQKMVTYIGEEYRFVWDPEVVGAINRIGHTLSRAIGQPPGRFQYYIIDRPTVNAFTSPLGDIFLFSGMLVKMRSSSELAGVLAHEMAHVQADHFSVIQKRAALATIPGLMAAILTKGDPRVIISTIAAAQAYQLHWSRAMELESDRLALQYLRKTGYDPEGLLGGLQIIEKGERLIPREVPEHLLTHPVTSDRVTAMEHGLGMKAGDRYTPEYDPAWERVRAALIARTGKPWPPRTRITGGGSDREAEDLDLQGLVLARRERYRESEARFRRALELDPLNPQYLADLGASLFHQGKLEEAQEALQGALDRKNIAARSYPLYYLAEIYRQKGDAARSHQALEDAVEAWPPLPVAHYKLALQLSGEERLGEADYHFGMASLLRGQYAAALRSFNRAEARLRSNPVWASRIADRLRDMR